MTTQVKIIKGNTGWDQDNFIEDIANEWLNTNQKAIDITDIRFTPANNTTDAVLMIIYRVKTGKKINNSAKGYEY